MGHLELASHDTAFDAVANGQLHASTGRTAEECLMKTVDYLESQEHVTLSKEDKSRILRLLAKSGTRKD